LANGGFGLPMANPDKMVNEINPTQFQEILEITAGFILVLSHNHPSNP
jgi:hypothetical protein